MEVDKRERNLRKKLRLLQLKKKQKKEILKQIK